MNDSLWFTLHLFYHTLHILAIHTYHSIYKLTKLPYQACLSISILACYPSIGLSLAGFLLFLVPLAPMLCFARTIPHITISLFLNFHGHGSSHAGIPHHMYTILGPAFLCHGIFCTSTSLCTLSHSPFLVSKNLTKLVGTSQSTI